MPYATWWIAVYLLLYVISGSTPLQWVSVFWLRLQVFGYLKMSQVHVGLKLCLTYRNRLLKLPHKPFLLLYLVVLWRGQFFNSLTFHKQVHTRWCRHVSETWPRQNFNDLKMPPREVRFSQKQVFRIRTICEILDVGSEKGNKLIHKIS